jgi:pyruvate/2-oxoglutarate dehydrogenase complex dihydrolipoamide dehydrogenase (E3) component
MSDLDLLPKDTHNRRTQEHVHPSDWTNPVPDGRYNLVVIGAGTAGLVTAAGAAGLGAKVALVERKWMGGDCLNVGCVPSKALIRSARAAEAARNATEFGLGAQDPEVDFSAVMERLRSIRADIAPHDSATRFRDLGVDVFLGEARFESGNRIRVGDQELEYAKAVIATGARAAAPAIPGLENIDYLTNENLFTLTEQPASLGIIGAGPIGCEMAQTFASLGVQVVQLEQSETVLAKEGPEAGALIKASLESSGVTLFTGAKDLKLEQSEQGISMTFTIGGTSREETVEQLLIAVGRAPNVEGLNLEAAGVKLHDKGVWVDDRLRTHNPDIFACGDVCSAYQFTHAADFMARMVIQNALFMGRKKLSGLVIPWCTYTTPEVAHVGLSEAQAQKEGVNIDTYTVQMSEVDRAILDGKTDGFVRIHTQKGSDTILGATIVASHAGDLINEIVLAMTQGIGLGSLANAIHPYPTQAEAIRKAGDLYNRTRLTPKVKSLFETWLRWRR